MICYICKHVYVTYNESVYNLEKTDRYIYNCYLKHITRKLVHQVCRNTIFHLFEIKKKILITKIHMCSCPPISLTIIHYKCLT